MYQFDHLMQGFVAKNDSTNVRKLAAKNSGYQQSFFIAASLPRSVQRQCQWQPLYTNSCYNNLGYI
ncbi:MAG: hypothetical protein EAZ16_08795 [Sphingobacteriales bacterium]|nr:MAG: hypothetical protein EAZ16_08795 [Sphingobacteriales bacterium]